MPKLLRDTLNNDAATNTILFGDDIDQTTIQHFIACISPTLRSSLPTHDLVEVTVGGRTSGRTTVRATEIQWTMQKLQDLYMLSQYMGADHVCDMIIDRWHEELHRPTAHLLKTEWGPMEPFDILGFDPTFLNFLAQHDDKGIDFLVGVLIVKGRNGRDLLVDYGLNNWSENMKEKLKTLTAKLECEGVLPLSLEDPDAVCQAYHHHHEHDGQCYRAASKMNRATELPTPLSRSAHDGTPMYQYASSTDPEKGRHLEIQRASTEKEGQKRKRGRDEDDFEPAGNAHMQKKLKAFHEENDNDSDMSNSSKEDLEDSDEEDPRAVRICLPKEYTDARYHSVSMQEGEEEEEDNVVPYNQDVVPPNIDRIRYPGKGMNGTKDSQEAAQKKLELVEKQLELFRAAGYDVDNMHVALPEEDEYSDSDDSQDE
ncbi:hypothetical protein N0V83_003683 [Neocucurbitaria cava]|uniref:Uncharacterized protein n=1 Tax=Neocucurbitaria cava TaxID=798079 RepID=A0A9W8YEH4_9PLEO|nr:hypothetical protein N0V83_003683 [Neocucurbitaria cava]